MAVAYRSSTSGGGAAATSHTLTTPTGIADGDVLIAVLCINNAATVSSPPSGWVQVLSDALSTTARLAIWSKVVTDAAGEPGTYSFGLSGSQSANYGIAAFSGVDTASLWDTTASAVEPGFQSSVTVPSVTTVTAGSMGLMAVALNSSSATWGIPSGWTGPIQATGNQCVALAYKAMPSAGATGSGVFTFGADKDSVGWGRALKASTSSGPTGTASANLARHAAAGSGSSTSPSGLGSGAATLSRHAGAGSGSTTAPATTFPVPGTASTEIGTSLGANNAQTLPSYTNGDLLLAFVSNDSTTQPTVGTGSASWTSILAYTNASRGVAILGRISTGSDTLTLSGSGHYCVTILPVSDHGVSSVATDIKLAAVATNATGMPDAPSLDAGSVRDWLWLAFGVNDVGAGEGVWSTAPSNYTSASALCSTTAPVASASTSHAVAYRELTAQTEDPGVWATGWDDDGEAWTLAVPPSAAPPPAGTGAPTLARHTGAGSGSTSGFPGTVTATVESEVFSGASGDVADSMWIWRNPADPDSSFVLAVNKSTGSDGGVYTLALDGTVVDSYLLGSVNGIDGRDLALYDNVASGWSGRVLLAMSDRTASEIAYGWLNRSTGEITSAGGTSLAFDPYGLTMYVSPVDGKVYAFVSEATGGSNALRQYELTVSGSTVSGTSVRTLDTASLAEGMDVSEPDEWFFLGEEDAGLYRYDAEPDGGTSRTTVDTVAGNLTADVEGVAVVAATLGLPGYLIASSQGSSDFQLYELANPHTYLHTFSVVGAGGVDNVTDTDGLDVLRASLGSAWPSGLMVVHDATNTGGAASNLKFIELGQLLGDLPGYGVPSLARHVATGSGATTGIIGTSATTLVRHSISGVGSTGVVGVGAPTLARLAAAGSGTHTPPGGTGAGSPILARHTGAGSGSTTIPSTSGSGASTCTRHVAAGVGSTGLTGAAGVTLIRHASTGGGSTTNPSVTGAGTPTLARRTGVGAGVGPGVPANTIKVGASTVSAVRLGSSAVDSVRLGSDIVL